MPYTCAMCQKTSDDPAGWPRIQITHAHYIAGPSPQTSGLATVTMDDEMVVLDCCSDECRDAWKAKSA